MSGQRDDLAVAVEGLIRARLRPAVETENELQIDAALSAAADDVAAACRERERVSYHAGRDDERVGAPCPFCDPESEPLRWRAAPARTLH